MRNRLDIPATKVKQRRGTANNLPGARAPKPGWKEPIMALAKVVAWKIATETAGGDTVLIHTTDWKALGVTSSLLFEGVTRLLPEFLPICRSLHPQWKNSEVAEQLMNRLWYMFRHREDETVVQRITREHPECSKRLLPYVVLADCIVHQNKPYKFER